MSSRGGAQLNAVHWSAAEALLRSALQLLLIVLLARWVSPADFGIYALLMVVVAVAGMLVDAGLAHALIRVPEQTPEDESSVFWFVGSMAGIAAWMLVWGDRVLAELFGQPRLGQFGWAAGLVVLMNALQCVPAALASKRLDFRSQAQASLTAGLVAGAVALWLGWRGAGIWALVAHAVTTSVAQTGLLWLRVPWRPRLCVRTGSLRRLFRFSGYLLLANIVDAVATRLHLVLIGRLYDAGDLGQFTRAASTRDVPQSVLAGMFARVAFPVFSAQAADPVALRLSLRRSIVAMMAVNLPIMAGLAALAELIVPVVFGPNWGPSVPLLQALCVAGALWPAQVANVQALLAQGHSRLLLKMEFAKKGVLILATLVASRAGIEAIAWALSLSSVFAHAINASLSGRLLGYGNRAQFVDLVPYAGLTLVMIAGVLVLQQTAALQPGATSLVLLVATGGGIYLLLLRLSGLDGWPLLRALLPARRIPPRISS